jgi:hypothetical protein
MSTMTLDSICMALIVTGYANVVINTLLTTVLQIEDKNQLINKKMMIMDSVREAIGDIENNLRMDKEIGKYRVSFLRGLL